MNNTHLIYTNQCSLQGADAGLNKMQMEKTNIKCTNLSKANESIELKLFFNK